MDGQTKNAYFRMVYARALRYLGGALVLAAVVGGLYQSRLYFVFACCAFGFSFLCWAVAGIKTHKPKFSLRTAPSGGARHPLDLFAFVRRVEGLDPGLYRYLPVEHALGRVRAGDDYAGALVPALRGQDWNPAAVFAWAAVPYRSEWRYGPASHKLLLLDAGHSCENLYLACEAIGAGTCAVGAYDQEKLNAYLGLDGEDRIAMYAAPVGKPAD